MGVKPAKGTQKVVKEVGPDNKSWAGIVEMAKKFAGFLPAMWVSPHAVLEGEAQRSCQIGLLEAEVDKVGKLMEEIDVLQQRVVELEKERECSLQAVPEVSSGDVNGVG